MKKFVLSVLTLSLAMVFAPLAYAAEPDIKVDLHHVLIEAQDSSTLQVREVLKINNTGKTAWSGNQKIDNGRPAVLKVPLPAGYTNLRVEGLSQNSLIPNPDGVITTTPLSPGITQLSFYYQMPIKDSSLTFAKTINYPTGTFYVLSPKGQFNIKGDQGINDIGIQAMDNSSYHVLLLEQAQPGQKFSLAISLDRLGQGYQEPKSGFHSSSHLQNWSGSPLGNTNPHMWVAGIILLFFAAAAAIGYYLRKRQQQERQLESERRMASMLDNLVIRQKRLLNKIDSLDEKNERGELDPEEYANLRQQYKEKLIIIKMKIKELELLEEEDYGNFPAEEWSQ